MYDFYGDYIFDSFADLCMSGVFSLFRHQNTVIDVEYEDVSDMAEPMDSNTKLLEFKAIE